MDKEKKVMALLFPEPDGTEKQIHAVCKMVVPTEEWMQEHCNLLGKPMSKELLHGAVRMWCGASGSRASVELNGKTYYGNVVFVAYDEEENPIDISGKQAAAIKTVVKGAWKL
jgi:hypothetical protein